MPQWILKWSLDGTYLTDDGFGDNRRDEPELNKWTKKKERALVFDNLFAARKACEEHDCDAFALVPEMVPERARS